MKTIKDRSWLLDIMLVELVSGLLTIIGVVGIVCSDSIFLEVKVALIAGIGIYAIKDLLIAYVIDRVTDKH